MGGRLVASSRKPLCNRKVSKSLEDLSGALIARSVLLQLVRVESALGQEDP